MPSDDLPLTDYDRSCGFASGTQAMRTRWQEDRQALASLACDHVHLGVLDSQYATLPAVSALSKQLAPMLLDSRWDTVVVPMGLFHCDHECVSDACMAVLAQAWLHSSAQWVVFEDVPYRRRWGVMQSRLAAWLDRGWVLTPVALESRQGRDGVGAGDVDCALHAKQKAVACYASQLPTLGLAHGGDQDAPERFWSITPR